MTDTIVTRRALRLHPHDWMGSAALLLWWWAS